MAATNTPIPDLIELSSIGSNATYTVAPGGGGDIIGVVDNGTYSDSDGSNSATQLAELNEDGILSIDGVDYTITLAVPDSSSDDVTITYNNGASTIDLGGSGSSSDVAIIQASPIGGGATRYFVAIDDSAGDLPDITSIQMRDLDFTPAGDDVRIDLEQDQNVAPVCFTLGVQIETPLGPVKIEDLRVGDTILTVDGGAQPIRWIGRRSMVFGPNNAQHKPVEIKKGAFGPGQPLRDMSVSPQHRLLIEGAIVRRAFGTDSVLAPAKGLTRLPGVRVKKGARQATYFALLLDRHHVIIAEGAKSESFYPGPMALRLLTQTQRRIVEAVVSELHRDGAYGPTARKNLTCKQAAALVGKLTKQKPKEARQILSAI